MHAGAPPLPHAQERRRVALNSRFASMLGYHREEALARFANHEVLRLRVRSEILSERARTTQDTRERRPVFPDLEIDIGKYISEYFKVWYLVCRRSNSNPGRRVPRADALLADNPPGDPEARSCSPTRRRWTCSASSATGCCTLGRRTFATTASWSGSAPVPPPTSSAAAAPSSTTASGAPPRRARGCCMRALPRL